MEYDTNYFISLNLDYFKTDMSFADLKRERMENLGCFLFGINESGRQCLISYKKYNVYSIHFPTINHFLQV